jgi:dihydroxyacetone kinase-like predicted kinase
VTGRSRQRVDVEAFRLWCRRALDGLRQARTGIDALNVFPVADADTGTNLTFTLEAVVEALDGLDAERADLGETARVAARASLWGARGSSGAILSQFLHGVADVLADPAVVSAAGADGTAVQVALARAADAAYAAVAEPMEGTILSVARVAAKAAAGADPADLGGVVRAALAGAQEELALTPSQLPVLAASGVVDAGGQGLVVVLDALHDPHLRSGRAPSR